MKYDDYIDRHAPRTPVVFLRLYLGLYFLYRAVVFFSSGMVKREIFDQRLQQLLDFRQLPVLGWYFGLLGKIGTEWLASGVLAIYLMVGISLLFGLHVRLFGIVGCVFLLHCYLFGYLGPVDDALASAQHTLDLRLNEALMVVILVVIWTAAGRRWGVDGMVWRRQLKREFAYGEPPELDPIEAARKQVEKRATTDGPTDRS